MKLFVINLVLAMVWQAAAGATGVGSLMFGFAIGYLVLWWVRPVFGASSYFEKLPYVLGFLGFFIWELIASNLRVAWDVITPRARRRPGILAVPLDVRSEAEITFLANLLSLTPGTLALNVSEDGKVMYVHAMFVDDVEKSRRRIKHEFERRIIALLR